MEKGASVLRKATVEGQRLRRELFRKLTEEERAHLARIYKKMNSERLRERLIGGWNADPKEWSWLLEARK